MSNGISLLKNIRTLTSKVVADFSHEQLIMIPQDFKNNIMWNVGHIITVQQMLTYGLAGHELKIDASWVPMYKKGSSPDNWDSAPDWTALTEKLHSLCNVFEKDYQAGLFENFREYQTATGPLLKNIDDAIDFNNFHEGLHLGTILALRKLVK